VPTKIFTKENKKLFKNPLTNEEFYDIIYTTKKEREIQ
jgi:hypothetical protein